ncbi:MAG: GHKL domain-containing protein [Oscillospiraceae bacterium]
MLFLRVFLGYLLQMAPFAFLCLYPFWNHLRFSKRKTAVSISAVLVVLGVLFAGFCCYLDKLPLSTVTRYQYANSGFFLGLLLCFVCYFCTVTEHWAKKLYIFSFISTCALAITSVGNIVYADRQTSPDLSGLPYDLPTLATLAIFTAVAVPLLWLLLRHAYLPVSDGLTRRECGYLAGLSLVLFFVLLSGLLFFGYHSLLHPPQSYFYIILMVAIFTVYLLCFMLFYFAHQKADAQQALLHAQHQIELNNEQYKRIRDNIEVSRRLRHDFHHHVVTLQGYLAIGDTQKAQEYLSQFSATLEPRVLGTMCENQVVDVIVSYYYALAQSYGITFQQRIQIPRELTVRDADLSVLLGNLLENAIAGADSAAPADRHITLNIICSGKMLAITVDNGFNGVVLPEGDSYRSTKENHSGVGLQSVAHVAEQYGGGVEFTHEPLLFHASVMLNIG